MAEKRKLKVGISHGDINGVSYEIIMKTLTDTHIYDICTPIVYGSSKAAGYYKKMVNNMNNFSFNVISSPDGASQKMPNIINCTPDDIKIEVGVSNAEAGSYALSALKRATDDLKAGTIDVLVTCPINKANIQSDEFNFMGHTEYLESKFSGNQLMFMISERLKIGMVTNHRAIAKVAQDITEDAIIDKLNIIKESLVRDFACTNPKIALLSLNPHVGDNGIIGKEENEVIIPAMIKAKDNGIDVFGPFAADGFFSSGNYLKYDATLAMYHDQGMIPFKMLAVEDGVNYTAGLSVVRTSPAHGVAYDIAGQNKASEMSLRHAIYSAIDTYHNRSAYDDMSRNPLPNYAKDNWGKDTSASDIKMDEPQD